MIGLVGALLAIRLCSVVEVILVGADLVQFLGFAYIEEAAQVFQPVSPSREPTYGRA
jgi:hypothetical protein